MLLVEPERGHAPKFRLIVYGVVGHCCSQDLDRNPEDLEGAEGLRRNEKGSCFWNMHGQWNQERGEGERVRQRTGNGGGGHE